MILVTGASGFVGRALASSLDRRGAAWSAVTREELVAPSHRFEVADALVHLAAIAHRTGGIGDEREYDLVNRDLAVSAARKARTAGIRLFVFISTAKVMGDVSPHPWNENDTPNPPDAYSRAKLQAEYALLQLRIPGEFEVTIIRPPLVYGPGVRGNFPSLLRVADSTWPLPLASATAPRSLISVANLADAVWFAIGNKSMDGHTVFVSDGADYTVAQIVCALRREFGREERIYGVPDAIIRGLKRVPILKSRVESLSRRLLQPSQVDIAAIRRLGWRPPHDTPSQLTLTCGWYRSRLRATSP